MSLANLALGMEFCTCQRKLVVPPAQLRAVRRPLLNSINSGILVLDMMALCDATPVFLQEPSPSSYADYWNMLQDPKNAERMEPILDPFILSVLTGVVC